MAIGKRGNMRLSWWGIAGAIAGSGALLMACGPSTVTDEPTCYSPTQNLTHAYAAGAKGCACDSATDSPVCAEGGVALICESGAWQAVEDGPCQPQPVTSYSPTSCRAAGGQPVPSPGGAQTPDKDCESGVSLGVIDAASSGWDEGGLCCTVDKDPTPTVACGAYVGSTCTDTEYCAYEEGELCGGTDAQAFCKPRPQGCIDLYAPVCGCDQITYPNSCVANAAGTGIWAAGKCVE